MKTQESCELMLHVQDGELFFGTGQHTFTRWEDDPLDFIKQGWVTEVDRVKFMGTAENAPLITELFNLKLKNRAPKKIYLCSPRLCLRETMEENFQSMLSLNHPPSVGGWHTMVSGDYCTYALIAALDKSHTHLSDTADRVLKVHPAYAALSFITDVDMWSAAQLIRLIVDPRWHIDPRKPERASKLKSFLGLQTPDGFSNVLSWWTSDAADTQGELRAGLVLDTWACGYESSLTQDVVGPGEFLLRAVKLLRDSKKSCTSATDEHKTELAALLKASHVFLRFLTSVWLDNLTPTREYRLINRKLGEKNPLYVNRRTMSAAKVYTRELFVPEYFFTRTDEVAAWKQHVDVVKNMDARGV